MAELSSGVSERLSRTVQGTVRQQRAKANVEVQADADHPPRTLWGSPREGGQKQGREQESQGTFLNFCSIMIIPLFSKGTLPFEEEDVILQ